MSVSGVKSSFEEKNTTIQATCLDITNAKSSIIDDQSGLSNDDLSEQPSTSSLDKPQSEQSNERNCETNSSTTSIQKYLDIYIPKMIGNLPGFCREWGATLGIASLSMFGCEDSDTYDPNQRPVLLAHGFNGNAGSWRCFRKFMQERKVHNIFSVSLGFFLMSTITDYAEVVRDKVEEIKEKTRQNEINFVVHSMGALVVREYCHKFAEQQDITVRKVVSLGGAFCGVHVPSICTLVPLIRDLLCGSECIAEQQEKAAADDITHYYILSGKEDIRVPPESVQNDRAKHKIFEIFPDVGHMEMAINQKVANRVAEILTCEEEV